MILEPSIVGPNCFLHPTVSTLSSCRHNNSHTHRKYCLLISCGGEHGPSECPLYVDDPYLSPLPLVPIHRRPSRGGAIGESSSPSVKGLPLYGGPTATVLYYPQLNASLCTVCMCRCHCTASKHCVEGVN